MHLPGELLPAVVLGTLLRELLARGRITETQHDTILMLAMPDACWGVQRGRSPVREVEIAMMTRRERNDLRSQVAAEARAALDALATRSAPPNPPPAGGAQP